MTIKSTVLSDVYQLMEISGSQSLSSLCRVTKKWGMYISLRSDIDDPNIPTEEDYIGAAPYLKYPENNHILINKFGYFLFDYQDDMEYAFDITVGDSGPTAWNDYKGPATVYALTCDPTGKQLSENTQ